MKGFIKIVLGSLVALILFGFVIFAFFAATITAILRTDEAPRVERGSALVFDMSANLTDSPQGADIWRALEDALGPVSPPTYSLRAVTDAIRAAATDDRIPVLFLHGNFVPEGYGSGFAALRELRQALLDFQATGKPLIAYLENPSVRGYYVASVADKVVINPYGMVGLNGLASQQFFIARALERYGVEVQVTRAGQYKTAVEIFTEEQMSDANRAQTSELIEDVWQEILESISESRGLTVDQLQTLADARGFIQPDMAVESGLADEVGYFDQVLGELRRVTGVAAGARIPQVDMKAYSAVVERPRRERQPLGRIAVIYIEGDIVDGEGSFGTVGGDRFAREIRRLRQSSEVSAIVVRVNSPGGSVSAAEKIQREISIAREKMPVAVSFGSFAASGGYWVATESDRIFAHPNTITGSIGVFGLLPNIEEIAGRIGVTFDSVKTARFADVMTIARPKTEEEMQLIQEMVDKIYDDFLERVAHGRNMSVEEVRGLAEGRIWSGKEAHRHGLVDEIGGLSEAIAFAAGRANLATWRLYEFPRPMEFADIIAEMLGPDSAPHLGGSPLQKLTRDFQADIRTLHVLNDPRGLYLRMPFSLRIE